MAHAHDRGEYLSRQAREAADAASRQISEAHARMHAQWERPSGRGRDLAAQLRRVAGEDSDQVLDYARSHPLQAAGLAFVAGLLLASLIRR